ADLPVGLPAAGESAVRAGLGFQPAAFLPPVVRVASVNLRAVRVGRGYLTVGGTGHDQAVEPLERLAAVAELGGQPIEQLRVRGQLAHLAEVVRRVHDATAKVV